MGLRTCRGAGPSGGEAPAGTQGVVLGSGGFFKWLGITRRTPGRSSQTLPSDLRKTP